METSDYSSGTDLELQSIQHLSPQTNSSFTFNIDEPGHSYSNDYQASSIRRVSLSSSLSSSSSSTSPSSSISNLSSLSSSSEHQTDLNNQSIKKFLSINNKNTSDNMLVCHMEKDNISSYRKRHRLNSYLIRRMDYCENCYTTKRTKLNFRSKYRQLKHYFSSRHYDLILKPIKFTVDLTGLNINYTIEYHNNRTCTCSTTIVPDNNSYINYCKYSLTNDCSSYTLMNLFNSEFYYIDANNHNHNSWFQRTNSILDHFYLTKLNYSWIYFNENSTNNENENSPVSNLRCMPSSIENECETIKKEKQKLS